MEFINEMWPLIVAPALMFSCIVWMIIQHIRGKGLSEPGRYIK